MPVKSRHWPSWLRPGNGSTARSHCRARSRTAARSAAAPILGPDFAYIGSAFIATAQANAVEGYKQMITTSAAEDIVYSNLFTGVHGNYLKPSIVAAGMDPENLPTSDPSKMSFGTDASGERAKPKAWKEICGSGQGVGSVAKVLPAPGLIARL